MTLGPLFGIQDPHIDERTSSRKDYATYNDSKHVRYESMEGTGRHSLGPVTAAPLRASAEQGD